MRSWNCINLLWLPICVIQIKRILESSGSATHHKQKQELLPTKRKHYVSPGHALPCSVATTTASPGLGGRAPATPPLFGRRSVGRLLAVHLWSRAGCFGKKVPSVPRQPHVSRRRSTKSTPSVASSSVSSSADWSFRRSALVTSSPRCWARGARGVGLLR
jgi:hypothetical protein